MNFKYKKLAAGIATGALFFSSLNPAAFAQYESSAHSMYETAVTTVTPTDSLTNFSFRSHRLFTVLEGSNEAPNPGDPDGFGFVRVNIDPQQGTVCVRTRVFNVKPLTASHIHKAAPGVAGPIVVTLSTPDTSGRASGCVSTTPEIAKAIVDNPGEYYVNVHNPDYPAGAARGQL